MVKKSLGMIAVFIVCGSLHAMAQNRYELTPFFGIIESGGFKILNQSLVRLDVESSINWGVTFGRRLNSYMQAELFFSRQENSAINGVLSVKPAGSNGSVRFFGAKVDQYHVNILYHFGEEGDKWRPYMLAGVGGTTLRPDGPASKTRFSFGVGGGIKRYFTNRLGLRAQIHYVPTYINSTTQGLWCGPYGCYVLDKSNYLKQVEFSGGLIIRF
jgi:hypothetical protein